MGAPFLGLGNMEWNRLNREDCGPQSWKLWVLFWPFQGTLRGTGLGGSQMCGCVAVGGEQGGYRIEGPQQKG